MDEHRREDNYYLGCHDYHAFPFQEENIDERKVS